MAYAVASKRVPLARLLERLLATSSASGSSALRPAAVAGGLRGYNTSGPLRRYDGDESGEDSVLEYDADRGARRYTVPSFFSDVLDPFSPPRSLSHLLNLMDDYAAVGRGIAPRRGWHAKDDDEALHLRVDLPGLGKEHVKVWAEQNSLVIKGEGEKESEEEAGPRYSSRIDLPPEGYKMDSIKAEMKNGVLRVVVPKVVEEERKDVFQVTVE